MRVRRHIVLFVPFVFFGASRTSPLQYMVRFGMPPYVWFSPFVFFGASGTPPPTMNKGFRSIFRLQPMFAFTKSLPQWGKVAAEG